MRRLAAAAVLLAALGATAAEPARNAALHKFFDRVFQEDMRENPELATINGVPGLNDKLADRSPAATERRKAVVKTRLAELKRFDPRRLDAQDRISREIMLDDLARAERVNEIFGKLSFSADFTLDNWLVVSPMWGVEAWFGILAKSAPTGSVKDYEDWLKRMEGIPRVLEQLTARMREAVRSGYVPPRATMTRIPGLLEVYAKGEPADAVLYGPFREFPTAVGPADRERLAARAREVIGTRVQPAFAALQRFVETEYIPRTRESLAASALPPGARYYEIAIEYGTTTRMTAREIHDIGVAEVARIRAEMQKVITSTGFTGTFAEFQKFLREDPRFYYTKPEDMLRAYRDIAKRADAELPRFFAELPRTPYGIRAMELHEGDNADHYSQGALDGSRAGFFDANVNNLAKRPLYDMESTLLHEAVPGHHLQIARALELKGLPEFRRTGGYTAYDEGWALYAESLGYEMGFYKDPYMHFGALSNEMLRACRLVIDTGLHAFDWTRDRSIAYLLDNTGVHAEFATAEVDRYIVLPGQALGYKVGELRIKALRAKATRELGDRFDVRRFHNALLDDGPVPLAVLEARIDSWIQDEKSKGRKP